VRAITIARKPLDGTLTENFRKHSTGGYNIDRNRVGDEPVTINRWKDSAHYFGGGAGNEYEGHTSEGRWPANTLITESVADAMERAEEGSSRYFQVIRDVK